MQQFAFSLGKTVNRFSPEALDLLMHYPFPGNVRELRNAVERAVTFTTEPRIQTDHLPGRIRKYHKASPLSLSADFNAVAHPGTILPLAEMEQQYIRHVLDRTGGNKRRAAALLGIGRRTLYRKIGSSAPTA